MAKRVAVVPWFAQGHMIPLTQLSRKMANTVPVTVVSTPRNILRMKSLIGGTDTTRAGYPIEFAEIALPAVEGLPAGVENTADVQGPEQLMKLMNAFFLLKDPLTRLLRDLAPDCVVCDVGVPVTGADLGIPTALFLGFSVSSFVANWYAATDRALPPLWDGLRGAFDRGDEEREVRKGWASTWAAAELCSAIVANTCDALEAPFMKSLSHAESKPVFGLGPLLGEADEDAGGECGRLCLDWIERRGAPSAPASAVVYVAFGSECFAREHDIGEIALGLEESGVAFLWALRRGRELLPRGFEERVRGRGLVVEEWVPQRRILKHRNVLGFVSHCGWNSVMEGLTAGVPLVAVPMQYEQGMNARWVAGYVKAAVEVKRDSDGRLCAGDVANAVKMVVSGGDGESVRKRAHEVSLVLQEEVMQDDGAQDAAVRRFVELIPSFSVKPLENPSIDPHRIITEHH